MPKQLQGGLSFSVDENLFTEGPQGASDAIVIEQGRLDLENATQL